MSTQKSLKLYRYVDGVNDTPFLNEDNNEIAAFKYNAKRMGATPSITFSLRYSECLDDQWDDKVYGIFMGRKFFLKRTPTSKVSNDGNGYVHDVELVDERVILDTVLFVDAVNENETTEEDKPITNRTDFKFFGNINEFARRLNASLRYSKIQTTDAEGKIKGYQVIVDDGVNTDAMMVSFEDVYFSTAIQEAYKTYEIPYYFKGNEIHFGYSDHAIPDVMEYGIDNAGLSISKQNANKMSVNRATGTGSSENIPWYYPNNSPKGDIYAELNSTADDVTVQIKDLEKFSNNVPLDGSLIFSSSESNLIKFTYGNTDDYISGNIIDDTIHYIHYGVLYRHFYAELKSTNNGSVHINIEGIEPQIYDQNDNLIDVNIGKKILASHYLAKDITGTTQVQSDNIVYPYDNCVFDVPTQKNWYHNFRFELQFIIPEKYLNYKIKYGVKYKITSPSVWCLNGEKVSLDDCGLSVNGSPNEYDSITQRLAKYIKPTGVLMPSIFRATDGKERFYDALNDTYTIDGRQVTFEKPYEDGHPREYIYKNEDIKPSIKEMKNSDNQRIDMFSEFAYDRDDNDETYIDDKGKTKYVHPYFFGKLRKLPFNLFDLALEDAMKVSMTSGKCGACEFEIGVDEETNSKNLVQVDSNGNLVYDENGRVLCGVEYFQQPITTPQDRQNDTKNYEVWLALKKDEETFGVIMPNVNNNYRPSSCTKDEETNLYNDDGDTFVLLNISMPQEYITAAEKELEDSIIASMEEDNPEKFNFDITFSRIFFEENSSILEMLDENASIIVRYNGIDYSLYVSSFSYTMSSNSILPEIKVGLADSLSVSENAIEKAVSQLTLQTIRTIRNIDVLTLANPYFIRKDVDDEVRGIVNFKNGLKLGQSARIAAMQDNGMKLTIDYLEVTKKATFTSLEIEERKSVAGQLMISAAQMMCGEVEELEDVYRCYYQTKNEGNDTIYNTWEVGDQAICQTFNEWGSKYYWRLVVGVGDDYIDLSKTDCDIDSDIPSEGDRIIQLGNRNDVSRQAAQVLSAHGDNAPSLIMYNGINSYSLVDKNITGIVWNPILKEPQMYSYGSFYFGDRNMEKNFITFQKKAGDTDRNLYINGTMTIGAGSDGLSNLEEWSNVQTQIDESTAAINDISADNKLTAIEKRSIRTILNSICEIHPSKTNYAVDYFNFNENNFYFSKSDYINGTINSTTNNTLLLYPNFFSFVNVHNDFHFRCRMYGASGNMYRIYTVPDLTILAEGVFTETGWKEFDLVLDLSSYIGTDYELRFGVANISGEMTTGVSFTKDDAKIRGSLIDWYRRCKELDGDTSDYYRETYGKVSYEKAKALFDYAEQFAIWDDTTTDIPSEFASKLQTLLNDYNESITVLNSETSTGDIDYLKKTFENGKTTMSGGVVMSEAVAVKNEEGEIEGMLNGSSQFSDKTHGKIILASGIPKEVNKNTDFSIRTQKAKTKIYEDGLLYSETISAVSGSIGGFNLVNGWLKSNTTDYQTSMSGAKIELSTEDFNYDAYTKITSKSITLAYPVPSGGGQFHSVQNIVSKLEQTRPENYPDANWDNSKKTNVCLCLESSGAEDAIIDPYFGQEIRGGNFAIWAKAGMFAGLRPMVRTVKKSTKITKITIYDHTIFVDPPLNTILNFYLPSEQIVGQEFEIVMNNVTNVSFKHKLHEPNNNAIINWPMADEWNKSMVEMTAIGVIKIYGAKDKKGNFRWWVYRTA